MKRTKVEIPKLEDVQKKLKSAVAQREKDTMTDEEFVAWSLMRGMGIDETDQD